MRSNTALTYCELEAVQMVLEREQFRRFLSLLSFLVNCPKRADRAVGFEVKP